MKTLFNSMLLSACAAASKAGSPKAMGSGSDGLQLIVPYGVVLSVLPADSDTDAANAAYASGLLDGRKGYCFNWQHVPRNVRLRMAYLHGYRNGHFWNRFNTQPIVKDC